MLPDATPRSRPPLVSRPAHVLQRDHRRGPRPTRKRRRRRCRSRTIVNTLSESIGLLVTLVALRVDARGTSAAAAAIRPARFRTAVVVFVAVFASPAAPRQALCVRSGCEWNRASLMLGIALHTAATFWLLYMAFEPYVRRFTAATPHRLDAPPVRARARSRSSAATCSVGVAAGTVAAHADRVAGNHSASCGIANADARSCRRRRSCSDTR